MRIEVIAPPDAPNKVKGDLLEEVAKRVLENQQYRVETQVRVTGAELDLLCRHTINRKQIYVECKAHREPLSAGVLKNILGEVVFKSLDEGWLITTGPLGKDAKGMQSEWEQRPPSNAQALTIYTPDRLLQILKAAHLVSDPPSQKAESLLASKERLGEWILLISPYGNFWSLVVLESGVPAGILAFSAVSGNLVDDPELLRRLGSTDASNNSLDFQYASKLTSLPPKTQLSEERNSVVQVAYGDSWSDYRPARPEHFVGRIDTQDKILRLFENIKAKETATRVFALTGDSGMGKSSLIAKLRERCKNIRNRNRYYIYAVDVRAATSPSYLLQALLACLEEARNTGFGEQNGPPLVVSDPSAPLESPSIKQYLSSLQNKEQVVALVFDQFEELYSKPELFSLFAAMQKLVLSTVSVAENFALGFAWKTDSTVQQDHPAYHMWHRLADHRLEFSLRPFSVSDASSALSIFQEELGQVLRPELRRQLLENSRGLPWLLKKLCIHVYEQLRQGAAQGELLDRALDVASLFERDLQKLTSAERSCLAIIARSAPADWYEVMEASGPDVLGGLRDKRLVVRSGDRLNIYWDIFREYILTKKVPSIPLSYLPSSQVSAFITMATHLSHDAPKSLEQLSQSLGHTEKSAANVVRDLVMFGVAAREEGLISLDAEIGTDEIANQALKRVRQVLKRHALTLKLATLKHGVVVKTDDLVRFLREVLPTAQHRERTWHVYAERMGQWLSATGHLRAVSGGWLREDIGAVVVDHKRRKRRNNEIFLGEAPPSLALEALSVLYRQGPIPRVQLLAQQRRNALILLQKLNLIRLEDGTCFPVVDKNKPPATALLHAAAQHPTFSVVNRLLQNNPKAKGQEIGAALASQHNCTWSESSMTRIGNSLVHWLKWIAQQSLAPSSSDAMLSNSHRDSSKVRPSDSN